MAYVIISTGSVTRSPVQTLTSGRLLLVAGVALALAAFISAGIGFRIGRSTSGAIPENGSSYSQFAPADGRAVVDRIGQLSGRVIQLETEAATLAAHIGVLQAVEKGMDGKVAAPAAVGAFPEGNSSSLDSLAPSGGPFVPADGEPADTGSSDRGDDMGLSRLERQIDQVAATLENVSIAAAPREIATMAYPGRMPISGQRITSGFGRRSDPFTGRLARHTGIDIGAPFGTTIRAAGGGIVSFAGNRSAYGKTVEIDHGGGLSTRYGHASRLLVKRGDVVLPRQPIAAVGSTGRSTGAHLHFEVLRQGTPVEPRQFLLRDGA
jgi:murein DD-endopeptidase MepM/ murein hydrolase activator NlpD